MTGVNIGVAAPMSFFSFGGAKGSFFGDLKAQEDRLRTESGTVSAIAGMLRAPLDMIADKLRGYLGLVEDLQVRPQKVLAACEALMPHLLHFALATADPQKNSPLGFWMHRGCVPFISFKHFDEFFWPTLKPVVQELWAHGHQTLFYAEGDWRHHLETFAELPDRSIIFHVDQTDAIRVHNVLGDRFCLSGGAPNVALAHGSPAEVRDHCRRLIETIGRDGGYIMDASAIIQNDATVENIRAMTEATLEYGVYSRGHAAPPMAAGGGQPSAEDARPGEFLSTRAGLRPPGTCISWSDVRAKLPQIRGDEAICRNTWAQLDALGSLYIWCVFLVF
jgi:hypothetical protein